MSDCWYIICFMHRNFWVYKCQVVGIYIIFGRPFVVILWSVWIEGEGGAVEGSRVELAKWVLNSQPHPPSHCYGCRKGAR